MARVPDYTPYDHMRAAQQVGGAVGRIIPEAVGAYVSGVKTEQAITQGKQKLEAGELKLVEDRERVLKAWRSKKAFKSEKANLLNEWKGVLKKSPSEWAEKQIKYLESADTAEKLYERNANLGKMLAVNKALNEKYPYISFANPDPAGAGAVLGAKAADDYERFQGQLLENTHKTFIGEAVKQIAADPSVTTSDEAVRRFADEYLEYEGANLTPEATKMIKDAFSLSEQDRLKAEAAQTKAEAARTKTENKANLTTNRAFIKFNNEENKLVKQILDESNINLRNLGNMGQFYDSEKFKELSEDKKVQVGKLVEKLQDTRDRKDISRAARALGVSFDEAQTENMLKDIRDDGRPSTNLHQRILEQMKIQPKESKEGEEGVDEELPPMVQSDYFGDQNTPQPKPKPQGSPLNDEEFLKTLGL